MAVRSRCRCRLGGARALADERPPESSHARRLPGRQARVSVKQAELPKYGESGADGRTRRALLEGVQRFAGDAAGLRQFLLAQAAADASDSDVFAQSQHRGRDLHWSGGGRHFDTHKVFCGYQITHCSRPSQISRADDEDIWYPINRFMSAVLPIDRLRQSKKGPNDKPQMIE